MVPQQVQELPLDHISCASQVRSRFNQESLIELARSIRAVGVQNPILVRRDGGGFILMMGERRFRACQLAGYKTIPAIVEEQEFTPGDIVQRQLIENVMREDLCPLEKAQGIKRLEDTEH